MGFACVSTDVRNADVCATASLEVEGANGSLIRAPGFAPTWLRFCEAPLHFAAGRITCLRAGASGWEKEVAKKSQHFNNYTNLSQY